MYYKKIDNKKNNWILLIHCICSNMDIFKNEIVELSKKYNILLVDLPGHGKSKNDIKFDFETVSREIVELLEKFKIEKIDIWGISLGAIVALYISEIVPNKIDSLILEGPAFGLKNKVWLSLFSVFNKIKIAVPAKLYIYLFINITLYGKNKKKIKKYIFNQSKLANSKGISLWLELMNKEYKNGIAKRINSINVSKKIYIGEKDYVFKYYILKNVKNNKFNNIKILKKSSHLCHLEDNSIINSLTLN